MSKKKPRISADLQRWIEARSRHRLSHAHIQMARELGLNPKSFSGMDNHRHETWKAPLPQYLESLYLRRFGKSRPDRVISIEERAAEFAAKKAAKRAARLERRAAEAAGGSAVAGSAAAAAPAPDAAEEAVDPVLEEDPVWIDGELPF